MYPVEGLCVVRMEIREGVRVLTLNWVNSPQHSSHSAGASTNTRCVPGLQLKRWHAKSSTRKFITGSNITEQKDNMGKSFFLQRW